MNGILIQHGYGSAESLMAITHAVHTEACQRHGWDFISDKRVIPAAHRYGGPVRYKILQEVMSSCPLGTPITYMDADSLWYDRATALCPTPGFGMTAMARNGMVGWQTGAIYLANSVENKEIVQWMIDYYDNNIGVDRDVLGEDVIMLPEYPFRHKHITLTDEWNTWEFKSAPVKPVVVAAHGKPIKFKAQLLAALLEVSRHA